MGRKKSEQKNTLKLLGVPSKRQIEFMEAKQKYVAYGGARAGGKSWALRRKLVLLALEWDGIRLLILRRTLQDLRENHTIPLRAELNGIAIYNDDEKAFYFPNGSRLKLGYCATEADVLQYQGQEYDVIAMDEGTQFTELQFTCLDKCLRGGNPCHPKRFYITCNPGGVGHAWVKRLFIDRDFRNGEKSSNYKFVKALVYDNDWIMKNQPEYVDQLKTIPDENLRKAWLNGEWDTFQGQFFPEFDPNVHVCKPLDGGIPASWNRYYVNDYGGDALAGLWIAISPENKMYVYREIFKGKDANDKEHPNAVIASDAAKMIKDLEIGDSNQFIRLAPPDLWSKSTGFGESPIDIFGKNGVYFTKADNNRAHGWMCCREWMKVRKDKNGNVYSNLQIFNTCKNLIRCLPLLQYDNKDSNDASTQPHNITHLPDAFRYCCGMRPYANYISEPNRHFDFEDMQEEYERRKNPYKGYIGGEVTPSYLSYGG